jgi:hypothetical protein
VTEIIFTPIHDGHLASWWQGELRIFIDRTAAEGFAKKQGLRAVFAAGESDGDPQ